MPTIDALRDLLWARDGGLCGICREPVARAAMHMDHITPVAVGGTDAFENLQAAHPRCNIRKSAGPTWPAQRRATFTSVIEPSSWTVKQAADYMQVSIDTVRRWCRDGTLRCISLGDRAGYRIRQDDLDRFLSERGS